MYSKTHKEETKKNIARNKSKYLNGSPGFTGAQGIFDLNGGASS